jgi:hypothetical protein
VLRAEVLRHDDDPGQPLENYVFPEVAEQAAAAGARDTLSTRTSRP